MHARREAHGIGRGLPRSRARLLLVPVFGLVGAILLLPALAAWRAPLPPPPRPGAHFDAIVVLGFPARRMRAEGWRTVLVVSSPSHLRRAALLFRETGLAAAFAPARPEGALGRLRERAATIWEAIQILRLHPAGAWPGNASPGRE